MREIYQKREPAPGIEPGGDESVSTGNHLEKIEGTEQCSVVTAERLPARGDLVEVLVGAAGWKGGTVDAVGEAESGDLWFEVALKEETEGFSWWRCEVSGVGVTWRWPVLCPVCETCPCKTPALCTAFLGGKPLIKKCVDCDADGVSTALPVDSQSDLCERCVSMRSLQAPPVRDPRMSFGKKGRRLPAMEESGEALCTETDMEPQDCATWQLALTQLSRWWDSSEAGLLRHRMADKLARTLYRQEERWENAAEDAEANPVEVAALKQMRDAQIIDLVQTIHEVLS